MVIHDREGRDPGARSRDGRSLLSDSAATVVLRVGAALLAFVTSIVLARSLGPEGYGTVAYVLSWTAVLGTLAGLGVERIVVRDLSACKERGELGPGRALVRETSLGAVLAGCVAILGAWGVITLLDLPAALSLAFFLALPLVVLEPLSRLRLAALQGLGLVVRSQLPELLLRPVLMLSGVCLVWVLLPSPLEPGTVLVVAVLAGASGGALGEVLLRWRFKGTPSLPPPPWLALAAPLLLVQLLHVITNRADLILLSMFRDVAEVGVFNVAARLADILGMALIATNFVLAPRLAAAWTRKDMSEAQALLTKATRGVTLASLGLVLGLAVFGPWIVGLYGPGFSEAYLPLLALMAGRIVSAGFGSVGVVLVTAGREKALLVGVASGAGVNILLNLLLIPPFGAMGAATATAVSIIVWNLVLGVLVKRKTGLTPGPWGPSR
jgi:O-antigen/teichoic acid export membrane protein